MTAKPPTIDERLRDIVSWGEALANHVAAMTLAQFLSDQKTQHAVSKCSEVVGEAAKEILKVDPDFDSQHPGLQLKLAARFRDRSSHAYGSINLEILWETATASIPGTVAAAKDVLARRQQAP